MVRPSANEKKKRKKNKIIENTKWLLVMLPWKPFFIHMVHRWKAESKWEKRKEKRLLKAPNNCFSCDHGNPSSFIWSIVGLGGRPRANQKVELPTFQLCNSTQSHIVPNSLYVLVPHSPMHNLLAFCTESSTSYRSEDVWNPRDSRVLDKFCVLGNGLRVIDRCCL